ncbi:MAG: hypothetical protein JW836_09990 [Deltaproteobacteria bacterium]|nr:hypothetical protein [Deltaproteobacteria bacterium]
MVIFTMTADTPSIRRKSTKTLAGHPRIGFEDGLAQTIDWYLENTQWVESILNGAYMEYYRKQYGATLHGSEQ